VNEPSFIADLRLMSKINFCSSFFVGSSAKSMSFMTIWSVLSTIELLGVLSFTVNVYALLNLG